MSARPAASPALDLEGEHPAARRRAELPLTATSCCGWLRKARVEHGPDARLGLQPGREARGGSRMPLGTDGQGQDAAQDEERLERAEGGAGVDLDAMRPRRSARSDPATTPAMTSLWPPRNFVADSTTRSAPSSSGRQTYGEAKVLSTTYAAPCRWASSARAAWSATIRGRVGDRLRIEDPRRRGGEGCVDGLEVRRDPRRRPGRRSRRRSASSWARVEP